MNDVSSISGFGLSSPMRNELESVSGRDSTLPMSSRASEVTTEDLLDSDRFSLSHEEGCEIVDPLLNCDNYVQLDDLTVRSESTTPVSQLGASESLKIPEYLPDDFCEYLTLF